VLRALLLTGGDPLYLRAELPGPATVSTEPLWSPPEKVAGRHLAPFLSSLARSDTTYSAGLRDRDPSSA
jgi:hypothetical protein